jgi:hypothetical protein
MGCFFCFLVAPFPAITTLEIDNLRKDKKMDGACGSVSMDQYWNTVATPLLFIVISFGLFVLFQLSEIQVIGSTSVLGLVSSLQRPGGKLPVAPVVKPTAGNAGKPPAAPLANVRRAANAEAAAAAPRPSAGAGP